MADSESLDQMLERLKDAENRLAQAIGTFVVRFAAMENMINRAIGGFLDVPSRVQKLLTAPIINVNTRLNILSSLVHGSQMDESLVTKFDSAITRARKLNDKRNLIIHDSWGGYLPISDEWQKLIPKTEKTFRIRPEKFSPAEILEQSNACIQLWKDFGNATNEYVRWRDKQQS